MKLHILISLLILGPLLTSSAFAQAPTPASVVEVSSDFDEEGLSDEDTQVDLAAEALPTTNKFGYFWERFRGAAITALTFNAEKKAAQYRLRLHNLDRKLAACSEIGDEECLVKIEERMQKLSDRTEKYIAKRKELKEQFLTRFQDWRDNRESLIQAHREKAEQLRGQRQELRQQRQANRKESRQRRQEHRQQVKDKIKQQRDQRRDNIQDRRDQRQDNIQDRRDQRKDNVQERRGQRQDNIQDRHDQRQLNTKQRQENREELIRMRSGALKQKLDDTRIKVQTRQEALTDSP